MFLSRLNIGPFHGGLNVVKKSEIAALTLKMQNCFGEDATELHRQSLDFDAMLYKSCAGFESLSEAILDSRLITFQEESVEAFA